MTNIPSPIFLLSDFDGVFAPIAQMPHENPWPVREFRTMVESNGALHSFYVYPEMIRRMKALVHVEAVNPFWLTTWKDETDAINKMLGLHWEEAGEPDFVSSGFSWKEQLVIDAHERGASMVWLEDEPTEAMLSWVLETADPSRLLHINPVSHIGITPQDMDLIERFTGM